MSGTEISRFIIPGFTYDLYRNICTVIRNAKVPPSLYGVQAKIVADLRVQQWTGEMKFKYLSRGMRIN